MNPTQILPPGNDSSDFKMENITREELKRIEKSMKRPQFMGLLNQYMIEISDPKNRQQYDEYLKQMQREGELPKHMRLTQLTPQFCVRTNIVSEKNKKHNMKFFINFCSTQFLDEPGCEPQQNPEGKISYGWKVPNSMGKIRYDQDKHGTPCQVADIAFNQKCFEIIDTQATIPFRKNQFKSMIISIGLQCAEKQLGQRKQTLSKDFDILKNLKCKGGKPALLPLRYIKGKAYNKGQGPDEAQIQRNNEGRQTKLEKQINQKKQQFQKQKQKSSATAEVDEMQEQVDQGKVLVQDLSQGIQQPKYSSIYTYPIDYSQFMQDPAYMKTSKTPSHFTVEFKLPKVQGMQQIGGDSLNVNENRIVLKIGQKYFIDLSFEVFKLKYKLLTDKIKAKFDKKKKVLKIIMAIDLSIKYQQPERVESSLVEQIESSQNVVQNQTWKNKLLEVSDPNVNLKVIDQQQPSNQVQQVPQKKLIQQIDEDDQVQSQKKTAKQNIPSTYQQALQQQKNGAFSLRKYYQKNVIKPKKIEERQIIKPQSSPYQLAYVFQQTSNKIVLIFKMQNYKKDQVYSTYNESTKNDFLIEWNRNDLSTDFDVNKIGIINFRIKQQFSQQVNNVQIVCRIGFVAVFMHKITANKFWENQAIQLLDLKQDAQALYDTFKRKFNEIQTHNKQVKLIAQRIAKETKEIVENVKQKSKIDVKVQQPTLKKNDIQNNGEATGNSINDEIDQDKKQDKTKLQGQYFNFNNLPPQFINFDLKFIDAMD